MRGIVAQPLSARSGTYRKPGARPFGGVPGARPDWHQPKTGCCRPAAALGNAWRSDLAACAAEKRDAKLLLQSGKALQLPGLEVATDRDVSAIDASTTLSPLLPSAPLDVAPAFFPYRWMPVQRWQHGFTESKFFMGTFVNTLSLDLSGMDLAWNDMQLPDHASRPRQVPRCCLLGDGMILCSGMVRVTSQQDAGPEYLSSGYLARLPEGMRPTSALPYTGLCQEVAGKARSRGQEPQLVMLVVTPDGWIQCLSEHAAHSFVDLSAVRFCLGRGVAIRDQVRLHTCDLPGSRLVMLQGSLSGSSFQRDSQPPLTQLPPACRPKGDLAFVVPGARVGSHHLVSVTPTDAKGFGANVMWSDAMLDHDVINLTGIMYEVGPAGLQHSIGGREWSDNRKKIVVLEFQNILLKKYGTIKAAWDQIFDTEFAGHINFTKFGLGCRAAGYKGNLFRLWKMLDDDGGGEITLDELEMDHGQLECSALPLVPR